MLRLAIYAASPVLGLGVPHQAAAQYPGIAYPGYSYPGAYAMPQMPMGIVQQYPGLIGGYGFNGGLGGSQTIPLNGPAGALRQGSIQAGLAQRPGSPVTVQPQPKRAQPALPHAVRGSGVVNLTGSVFTGHAVAVRPNVLSLHGHLIQILGVTPVPNVCNDRHHLPWRCGTFATTRLQDLLDQGTVRCRILAVARPLLGTCQVGRDNLANGMNAALALR